MIYGNIAASPLRERVYLQTDKNLYLAGETVLMKILTTDTELIPVDFSKTAYIELVSKDEALFQIMVEMKKGIGMGQMKLPTDLPSGYYRLIAYTQFMRNESVDEFFEKNIVVINTFISGYYLSDEELATENNINNDEKNDFVSVKLVCDKNNYPKRTNGQLTITQLPENIHTLSVTIAGKDIIPTTETNVSLFNKNRKKISSVFTGEFLPEYEGHTIYGNIIDSQTGNLTDEVLSKGISIPGDGIRFFAGQKVKTGEYRFITSGITDSKEVATVIYHADEKYKMEIVSPFVTHYIPTQMPELYIDSVYYGQLLARSVALQALNYFSDNSLLNRKLHDPLLKLEPTRSFILDEYTRFTTMREVFTEFITGARFRRNSGKQEVQILITRSDNYYEWGIMPLVLLDGAPIPNHDAIFKFDPLLVEKINIYNTPIVMGGLWFDGIVELITYTGLRQGLDLDKSTQILSYEGPQSQYNIDYPDYSNEKNRYPRIPDSRHTLLWKPDIRLDGNSNIHLPFSTSDLTGEFQITVEGVTKDGKLVVGTAVFVVE